MVEFSLDRSEQRAVQAVVDRLREALGDELVSIWLYGSRARGETPGPESDIDLLVLVREAAWRRRAEVQTLAWEAVDAAGENEGRFSVRVDTPEWLRGRREIESFFVREVDRDKVILYGDP
jgi:predicted nucleotidyltransferase